MYKTSSNFSVSYFRRRGLAWIILTVLCFSFLPSVSLAQQLTAAISTLSGTVLVNGQEQKEGAVLSAGDVIETQAGASVVLELSDGSEIHLGEKTQINIADLAQTATGARVSYIKLLAGRLRALLSPGHQQEGSSFTVETPNAQVGVKFSQPDVEVSYDPEKQETVGIAHTIELIATNLLTGETMLVPVGSSVIIIGMMMKVIAGTTAAAIVAGSEAAAAETATGIGTGTKVAIGAGAVAAAGGVAAVAASSGDGSGGDGDGGIDWDNPFSGTFTREGSSPVGPDYTPCVPSISTIYLSDVIDITQDGMLLTGTYSATLTFGNCCTATSTVPFTATVVDETTATNFSGPNFGYFYCEGANCSCEDEFGRSETVTLTLVDNGRILRLEDNGDIAEFYRQ